MFSTERQPRECIYCDQPASYVPGVGDLCTECTESYAKEVDRMDQTVEASCYEKAKANGEPTFTLRAQDISAHLVVEFWATAQRSMRALMDAGATATEAVEAIRSYHNIPRLAMGGENLTEKDRGALEIARAMMGWKLRKQAD